MSTETITPPIAGTPIPEVAPAIDLRRHTVPSLLLGGARDLVVFLPPGYEDEPERRYPVLYMHDGQNLFDPETAYVKGKHWRLNDTARELIDTGRLEPLIIVGIYHAGEKRIDEYTPTRDPKQRRGGKATQYLDALANEFKPFIDAHYRTLNNPQHTAVGGSSLGALIALFAGLQCPEVFGKVIAMSPSVWWDRRYIVRLAQRVLPKPRLSIWLDVGTKEGRGTLADVRALRTALEAQGWIAGQDLFYSEIKDATHDETSWGNRVGDALTALFPASGELIA